MKIIEFLTVKSAIWVGLNKDLSIRVQESLQRLGFLWGGGTLNTVHSETGTDQLQAIIIDSSNMTIMYSSSIDSYDKLLSRYRNTHSYVPTVEFMEMFNSPETKAYEIGFWKDVINGVVDTKMSNRVAKQNLKFWERKQSDSSIKIGDTVEIVDDDQVFLSTSDLFPNIFKALEDKKFTNQSKLKNTNIFKRTNRSNFSSSGEKFKVIATDSRSEGQSLALLVEGSNNIGIVITEEGVRKVSDSSEKVKSPQSKTITKEIPKVIKDLKAQIDKGGYSFVLETKKMTSKEHDNPNWILDLVDEDSGEVLTFSVFKGKVYLESESERLDLSGDHRTWAKLTDFAPYVDYLNLNSSKGSGKPNIASKDIQSDVFKILDTNDKNRIEQIDTLFRENSVFEEFNTNFGDDAYLLLDEIMDLLKDSEKTQTKKKPTKKKKKESIVTKIGEKVEIKPKKKTKKQIKEDEDLESLLLELEDTDVTAIADADIDLEDLLNSI